MEQNASALPKVTLGQYKGLDFTRRVRRCLKNRGAGGLKPHPHPCPFLCRWSCPPHAGCV